MSPINLQLGPILSSLRRHKTAALLIVLEIALASAILANAVFVVVQRLSLMHLDSGLAEHELVAFGVVDPKAKINAAANEEVLAALDAVPGVKTALAMNSLPFSHHNWSMSISTKPNDQSPNQPEASAYLGTHGVLQALGLKLVAGRDFNADEFINVSGADDLSPPSVILTQAMARKMFPDGDALGKTIYVGKLGSRVVGLVEHLAMPRPNRPGHTDDSDRKSVV